MKRKKLLFSVPYLTACLTEDLHLSFWTLLTSGTVLIYLYSQAWTLRFRRSKSLTSCQTWYTCLAWPQNMCFNQDLTIVFTVTPEYSRMEAPWNDPHLKERCRWAIWGCWNLLWIWTCLWLYSEVQERFRDVLALCPNISITQPGY